MNKKNYLLIKDVRIDFFLDHKKRAITFFIKSNTSNDYKIYDIKLYQTESSDEDVLLSLESTFNKPCGIFFSDGVSTFSPKDFKGALHLISTKISEYVVDITKFKSKNDIFLSTSLNINKYPIKWSKWFKNWVKSKVSSCISNFLFYGMQSLLGFSDFKRLEKQTFFLSSFSVSSWSDMHRKTCMKIIHNNLINDIDKFKDEYKLPISRKCLLYASIIDKKICFNPPVDNSDFNITSFFNNNISLSSENSSIDETDFFYDDWRTFLIKSNDPSKIKMIDRIMPFMRANFSYCYVKSFYLLPADIKINSCMDLRTAMCIAESVFSSFNRSRRFERNEDSKKANHMIQMEYERQIFFNEVYSEYLKDKECMIRRVCSSYPAFSGLKKTKSQILRSMPIYCTAWLNFIEKNKLRKDYNTTDFNIIKDDIF